MKIHPTAKSHSRKFKVGDVVEIWLDVVQIVKIDKNYYYYKAINKSKLPDIIADGCCAIIPIQDPCFRKLINKPKYLNI